MRLAGILLLLLIPPAAWSQEAPAVQEPAPRGGLRATDTVYQANCAVCHVKMDALGFGFENFDAVGRWRDRQGGRPIDSAGELPGGVKFSGPGQLVRILRRSEAKRRRSED